MPHERETPFDSIDGAREYVELLAEALEEARLAIQEDVAIAARTPGAERRLEALHLVQYKLNRLRDHLSASGRILNDLRMLRRLLLAGREEAEPNPPDGR